MRLREKYLHLIQFKERKMRCKECNKDIDEHRFCPHCGFEQYARLRTLAEVEQLEQEIHEFVEETNAKMLKQVMINSGNLQDPEKLMMLTENVKFVLSTIGITIGWMKGGKNPIGSIKEMHEKACETIFNKE